MTAAARPAGLSKSRIAAYEQCARRLWLTVHRPQLAVVEAQSEDRLAAGHQVGVEARRHYPDGVLIDTEHGFKAAIDRTRHLLDMASPVPLFEATFEHDGVLVMVDILLSDAAGGWQLTEVKSTTSAKAYHLGDMATQVWVLEQNGLAISQAAIRHIDNRFRLTIEGDYRGLFADTEVSDQIRPLVETRGALVQQARQMLAGGEPDILPGGHCKTPFACPFEAHCGSVLPPAPNWPVTVLPGGGGRKWLERGIVDLFDVPQNELTSPVHRRVHEATLSGLPYHDRQQARTIIGAWAYPRIWLDFETIGFVLPRWLGTKPYDNVPFQFSAQVERQDGVIDEVAFLDLSGDDPRRACAQALLTLPSQGAVIAYNAGFERSCILGLADACPDLAAQLHALADRLVDLLPVTRACWYHRDQRGSWSIKAVLPTVAPELDYGDLAVGNGLEAQAAYLEATDPATSPQRKAEIDTALRTYCERDTYAMIVLAKHLVGEVGDD
jgi:hypothetical protein